MDKKGKTIYFVIIPNGNIDTELAAFNARECKRKFVASYLPDSVNVDVWDAERVFAAFEKAGFRLGQVDVPNEKNAATDKDK